jgi:arsenate reductase|tara:strand:+ start:515 stop:904 length:390 start_codon:yes stop_codon:yes gene_type:complete
VVVVLFVCTGNAARSQMAEGWLKNLKSEFIVLSAGTKPDGLSPMAVKVMKEVGLDISNQSSKHLDKVEWMAVDYAITLCDSANKSCVTMAWPESCQQRHWPINDPVSDDEYRNARDEIKQRIEIFLEEF